MNTWPEYKRMLDEKRKRKNEEYNRNNNDIDFIMPLMAGYMAANAFNDNHNDNYNSYSDNNYDNSYSDNSYDSDYSDSSYDSSNDCMNMDFFDIF